MKFAERLTNLQANVFADMDQAKAQARTAGKSIIDLSLGSSDLPVAPEILTAISEAVHNPSTHGYLLFHGTQAFRVAVAHWYEQRFGLAIDPETEVLPLIGSQEGTAHLPLAILNPGDYALLLDPGYPSHAGGVYLAGGQVYTLPLLAENQFLPVFSAIPPDVLSQARMLVLSYPHNPTTAVAPLAFFQEAVTFCQAHDLVLVHDFPYVDLVFEPPLPPSVLQADLAKQVSIEFFSFSKSYSMGGFRLGFAIGNRQLIQALRKVKAVVDFNQYLGILQGAIAALQAPQTVVTDMVKAFQQRRDAFVSALAQAGWVVASPNATMYIWAPLPPGWVNYSREFCLQLVAETGVAASPGIGFGKSGEGYVRFALVHPPEVLVQAATKIGEFLQRFPGKFE
jgi:aspartate/methionine/tyrosine aminotransferase